MTIYLIKKESGELIATYNNVTRWAKDFVEYENGGRAKVYCDTETEYYTDVEPINSIEL